MIKNLVIVQQYLSWKGHYRQYFENLHNSKYYCVYASNKKEDYGNSKWIRSDFDAEKQLTIKTKIKGRFWDSFNVFKYLSGKDFGIIHFIEFEPLTYLLFANKLNARLLITIHSSDQLHFSNWLHNRFSGYQRRLLEMALRKAVSKDATIVTHYECHKESILKIIGDDKRERVKVINYPAPKPESNKVKVFSGDKRKYLIYGQVRDDKGIYEFLQNDSTKNLIITIAGKIVDRRILEFASRNNLTIIDKFLSEEEISELVANHDFMLLPYPLAYTNGAGTFKDSLSKAMPVVCSNIAIFREIIDVYKVGVIFENPDDIEKIVADISENDYLTFSKNCLTYATEFDWEYMRNAYFSVYDKLQSVR
ncbi:glycosyltransferase [Dyadobacter diqingensis]|uniref:glycosyltransferase n=1 Tax=Dyadobacter diqingensis TaxID=2938121 RepID=UPI0020C1B7EA|nr:glycosyltransferase [Dyadobacter diqingensis]